MNPNELDLIFHDAENWCEPAQKLRKVLDLLVQADLHEQRDETDDEVYASISEAKTSLFQIATAWELRHRGG